MYRTHLFLLFAVLLISSSNASAAIAVFTCEPEWKALAEEIGGDKVTAFTATTAKQDPHHIQARPSLIAKLRRADLLICSGAGLEEGWLPLLLRRARNPNVQSGQPGHLMAAEHVPLLEIPTRLDRSEGDIHSQGNPHIHLDPRNLQRLAEVTAERMAHLDPGNTVHYQARLRDFERRWNNALTGWEHDSEVLHGRSAIVHHMEWIYLLDWLGMERLAALEPKPGLPPSARHLKRLKTLLEKQSALAIIRSTRADQRPSDWLAAQSGAPVVVLPYTVGATEESGDLFRLFEEIIKQLAAQPR
ncbi:MAG: zinc ABC transporter substrate-binding protein [gamma proteobacterium endosymbiont of Lamellibrachia anaximandri]|nr:zinc ABC transporter substrate-binding protein [gamma proteobacterium endosymbiont of Lamellibrachia anaximandri]MBL3534541.1 zinc ABC transporter substrate-binding protein [gamma proteobacterium endosymbiont of Lamellibrachia anaximandri]